MGGAIKRIRRVVEHPATRLGVGFILFGSGFIEAYQEFSDLSHFGIGAHHGIMLFGLFNMFASIPDMIEGLSSGVEYLEHMERKRKNGVRR